MATDKKISVMPTVPSIALSDYFTTLRPSDPDATANKKNSPSQVSTSIQSIMLPFKFVSDWNATTNTPTLVSNTGTEGHFYRVSVAGTTTLDGISNWDINDLAWFDGSVWRRVGGIESAVFALLAGRTGGQVLNGSDTTAETLRLNNNSVDLKGILLDAAGDSVVDGSIKVDDIVRKSGGNMTIEGTTFTPTGDITLGSGTNVNEFSIDGTLAGDSDDAVPTEKAVKTYADSVISNHKVAVPATPTSAGTMGQWASGGGYNYICTATNVWIRWAIVTSW